MPPDEETNHEPVVRKQNSEPKYDDDAVDAVQHEHTHVQARHARVLHGSGALLAPAAVSAS